MNVRHPLSESLLVTQAAAKEISRLISRNRVHRGDGKKEAIERHRGLRQYRKLNIQLSPLTR